MPVGSVSALAFGSFFNACYVFLTSLCSSNFRASAALPMSAAIVSLFAGEALATTPIIPVAIKNWTVRSRRRLALFLLFGVLLNANFIVWRGAALFDIMPLGVLASIGGSGFLFAPAVTLLFHRRRVGAIEIVGVVAAVVGLLLITHPRIVFGETDDVPVAGYVLAGVDNVLTLVYPFFFAATADAHWSNFLAVRLACSAVFAAVCCCIGGGPAAVAAVWATAPTETTAMLVTGVASTVARLSQQIGCNELEEFGTGVAGILGNLIIAGVIPTTTLLGLVFFQETITTLEAMGIVVVFGAIVVVTVVKGCEKNTENSEDKD